jgi:hypothetical protein
MPEPLPHIGYWNADVLSGNMVGNVKNADTHIYLYIFFRTSDYTALPWLDKSRAYSLKESLPLLR